MKQPYVHVQDNFPSLHPEIIDQVSTFSALIIYLGGLDTTVFKGKQLL